MLVEITETADRICGKAAAAGESQSAKIQGDVKAELGFLAKKLTDLGIQGKADITANSYVGLLQSDLANTLRQERECKQAVFDRLVGVLLASAPPSVPTGWQMTPAQAEALRIRLQSIVSVA